jgi:hypothetical protein
MDKRMKIQGDMLAALERGMMECLKTHNLHPFMVKTRAHAWDVFHKAWNEKRIDGAAIYQIANDANLETAFRTIFRI